MKAFNKVQYSLRFVMGEFPDFEQEIKIREEGLGFIIYSGSKELKLPRDVVLEDKGDGQYYTDIRDFVAELASN